MELKQLRQKSAQELNEHMLDLRKEQFSLRMQKATGQLTNNRRIGTVKRDIARIYTVLRERELGLSVAPGAEA